MKRLLEIQQELKAPKDQYNSYGEYKFRSAEGILDAVKPLLKKHGLVLLLTDDIKQLDVRFYVQSTVTLYDPEENKEITHVTAYAREAMTKKGMDEAQITGAASSYARKYALNGLFAINDVADPDATNKHGKDENTLPEGTELVCKQCGKKITEGAFKNWNGLCADCYKKSKGKKDE